MLFFTRIKVVASVLPCASAITCIKWRRLTTVYIHHTLQSVMCVSLPCIHRCFPVNIAKFLRLPILKNICKRLFFDCFNGSLLHGPEGSRCRLYDGVRLQGPSHRSSFLFLSQHLSSGIESRPAFENLRRMSQLRLYIGYFWSF